LQDIDDLAERGLLQSDELQAAHAEAARRLLAEPAEARPERAGPGWIPAAAAGAAALVALGLYLWLGSPNTPDQPFKARLAAWRTSPINQLRPDEIAAALRDSAKTHPNDARLLGLLARIELQQGDAASAALDYDHAARLEPNNPDLLVSLAQADATAAGDKPSPDAEAALNRALAIDPQNPSALYLLGVLKANDGQGPEAARLWRKLASGLEAKDQRRAPLLAMADQAEQGLPQPARDEADQGRRSAAAGAAATGDQAAFIRSMVASLQARLDAQPDDPAGWARLVRSYRVLGDQAAEAKALARARPLFASRPKDLALIEAEAK
jgi:cytochrome c-type biogenesis protein CcmH